MFIVTELGQTRFSLAAILWLRHGSSLPNQWNTVNAISALACSASTRHLSISVPFSLSLSPLHLDLSTHLEQTIKARPQESFNYSQLNTKVIVLNKLGQSFFGKLLSLMSGVMKPLHPILTFALRFTADWFCLIQ